MPWAKSASEAFTPSRPFCSERTCEEEPSSVEDRRDWVAGSVSAGALVRAVACSSCASRVR